MENNNNNKEATPKPKKRNHSDTPVIKQVSH